MNPKLTRMLWRLGKWALHSGPTCSSPGPVGKTPGVNAGARALPVVTPSSGSARQNSRLTNIGTLSTVGPEPPLHCAIHYFIHSSQLLFEHSGSSIVPRP